MRVCAGVSEWREADGVGWNVFVGLGVSGSLLFLEPIDVEDVFVFKCEGRVLVVGGKRGSERMRR